MAEDLKEHWQHVYQTSDLNRVSWRQSAPERSLELIRSAGISPTAPILDVGGGDSTLVDSLLDAGYQDVTVLDLAPRALAVAQARLGAAAARVQWIEADVTEFRPLRRYALWHDRAVFHFLIDPERRERYLKVLERALAPDGHVILSTFGPQGPTRCSGLEVQRYSAEQLSALLGSGFRLTRSLLEDHLTPKGDRQQFLYGLWRVTDLP